MKAKSIKSNTKSTSNLHAFRVIVRGTVGTGKKARRVRHVLTTPAVNSGAAVLAAEKKAAPLISKLDNVYVSVLPPLTKAA